MANSLTKNDVYQIVNAISEQTMGASDIVAVDTTSFVTVGERLLRNSYEQTFNAISQLCVETIFSVRPYKGKLDIIETSDRKWGAITRKLVPLYKKAVASKDNNTNLNPTTLEDGKSVDPFEINAPKLMELRFIGVDEETRFLTQFTRAQLNVAFKSEDEFISFLSMCMTQLENEITKDKEDSKRLTVLNAIAGKYELGDGVVHLVTKFNDTYGTDYTLEDLHTTYLKNYVAFVSAEIQKASNLLTEYSYEYHTNLEDYEPIPRHTPKENQRMLFYEPFFIDAKTNVYTSLFNPELLNIGEYEGVNYWQNLSDEPTKVIAKANIIDTETGESVDGTTQTIPSVLGMIYDIDFMGWYSIFDSTESIYNPRGKYTNIFYSRQFKPHMDFTENCILFVED